MKNIILIALLLPFSLSAQYYLGNNHLAYNKNASVDELKKYTYENLRLYPVVAGDNFRNAFKNLSKFTTLKQAMDQKKIAVTEKGNGGTVNSVTVQNLSKDTIIINSGEVIKGGQQDRVINEDLVLYPNSGKKDLSVFCVEQGRWAARSESAGNTGRNTTAGSGTVAFSSSYNYSAPSLRKVVTKDKEQSAVWKKVKEINVKNKTETNTQTYTALEQSSDYKSKIAKYISFFLPRIKAEKDIVGVIVVSGDKVVGADIFASNDLFIRSFESLLPSYASEAIINGKPVTISKEKVDKYIEALLGNEKKQEEILKKNGSKFESNGKKLRISSFE